METDLSGPWRQQRLWQPGQRQQGSSRAAAEQQLPAAAGRPPERSCNWLVPRGYLDLPASAAAAQVPVRARAGRRQCHPGACRGRRRHKTRRGACYSLAMDAIDGSGRCFTWCMACIVYAAGALGP